MRSKGFNKNNFIKRRRRAILSSKIGLDFEIGKNIFTGVIVVCILSLILLGVFKILSENYFRVSKITSIGERSVSKESISASLSEINGKIIFFVSKGGIASELNKDYPEIQVEKIVKYWPNHISVVLSESDPLFFYTNLSGVYLINDEGKIIDVLFQDKINFSTEQLNIVTGVDGVNSSLVVERLKLKYSETKPEEEKIESEENFDLNSIPLEEKLLELNALKAELSEQSSSLMKSYQEKYDKNLYPDLESVYNFNNDQFSKGAFVDKNKLQLTREVVKFFNQVEKEFIKEIYWEGDFMVKVNSNSNKTLIFGTSRESSLQLSDYLVVTNELKNEGYDYKQIDFTSTKISVK